MKIKMPFLQAAIAESVEGLPAARALLFDVSPIPKTTLMKIMLTFQDNAMLIHFAKAYLAVFISMLELYLHFFSNKYQYHCRTYFSSQLLCKVISLKQRICDSNQNEVRTYYKKYKFIKEDRLESAVQNQLANQEG